MRRKVSEIPSHPEYVDEISGFVKENRGVEYAQERLSGYVDKAVSSLDIFPDTEDCRLLKSLALFVAERNS